MGGSAGAAVRWVCGLHSCRPRAKKGSVRTARCRQQRAGHAPRCTAFTPLPPSPVLSRQGGVAERRDNTRKPNHPSIAAPAHACARTNLPPRVLLKGSYGQEAGGQRLVQAGLAAAPPHPHHKAGPEHRSPQPCANEAGAIGYGCTSAPAHLCQRCRKRQSRRGGCWTAGPTSGWGGTAVRSLRPAARPARWRRPGAHPAARRCSAQGSGGGRGGRK